MRRISYLFIALICPVFLSIFYPLFSGEIRQWIIENHDSRIPVVAVTDDSDQFYEFMHELANHSTKDFMQNWNNTFHIKIFNRNDFKKEYPDIPIYTNAKEIALYFFYPDGMFLFYETFHNRRLPTYVFLKFALQKKQQYNNLIKSGAADMPPLYWPNHAYLSGLKIFAKELLQKIDIKVLPEKEKSAYRKLYEMCLH